MLSSIKQRLSRSNNPLLRSTSILVSGSALSQLLFLIATPLLTRLFDAQTFGMYATFMALSGILSAIFCFRYELAIFTCGQPKSAAYVVKVGLLLILLNSALTLLVLWLVYFFFKPDLPEVIRQYWYLVPLTASCLSAFLLLSNYQALIKHFTLAASAKVVRASAVTTLQTVLSVIGQFGLLLGDILGRALAVIFLGCKIRWTTMPSLSWLKFRAVLRKHKAFITYSTPAALLNVSVTQSPVFILGILYSVEIAGYYMVAQRVIATPITMLSQALSQAFSSEIAACWRTDRDYAVVLLKRTTVKLAAIGGPIIAMVALLAPLTASFIFGEQWGDAGAMMAMLCVMYFGQLLSAPFLNLFNIMGQQHVLFYWDCSRLMAVGLLFSMAYYLDWGWSLMLSVFCVVMCTAYLLILAVLLRHKSAMTAKTF